MSKVGLLASKSAECAQGKKLIATYGILTVNIVNTFSSSVMIPARTSILVASSSSWELLISLTPLATFFNTFCSNNNNKD